MCDTLVSIGGVESNHIRQVAAAAARLGLGCVLVQEPVSMPSSRTERRIAAIRLLLVRWGRIAPGSRVLHAYLGGQPALNAYAGAF